MLEDKDKPGAIVLDFSEQLRNGGFSLFGCFARLLHQ
jgi:hypothetical protein